MGKPQTKLGKTKEVNKWYKWYLISFLTDPSIIYFGEPNLPCIYAVKIDYFKLIGVFYFKGGFCLSNASIEVAVCANNSP